MLGCWDVPSHVAVGQDALKLNCDALSWEPPRGRVCLFIPGHLASPPSSLHLPQPT
jgi:hypothetical protein